VEGTGRCWADRENGTISRGKLLPVGHPAGTCLRHGEEV